MEKELKELEEKAKNGDISAQLLLGEIYYTGKLEKKDYQKAVEYYEQAAQKGSVNAQYRLGMIYFCGLLGKKDYQKAVEYLEKIEKTDNINVLTMLGESFYRGKLSYQKAVEYYERAVEKGNEIVLSNLGDIYVRGYLGQPDYEKAKECYLKVIQRGEVISQYNLSILKELGDRKVLEIDNISELDIANVDLNKYGAVAIRPKINKSDESNTLYSLDKNSPFSIVRAKKEIDRILQFVDVNNGKNEEDVFFQTYIMLAENMQYDYEASAESNNEERRQKFYISRNLIGGLLNKTCVCAGYAEILRNVLACREIECRCVASDKHAYNQVKLNGVWYYVDLTWDRDSILNGEALEWCLLSEKDFSKSKFHISDESEVLEPSERSYPRDEVDRIYKKQRQIISDRKKKSVLQNGYGKEVSETTIIDMSRATQNGENNLTPKVQNEEIR